MLIDWRLIKPLITSVPIRAQNERPICWAYAIADWLGINFSIFSNELESCSPMDLIDWVYSMQEVYETVAKKKKESGGVDTFGTYPCRPNLAITYARDNGVSLLANYEMKIEERKLEYTTKNEVAFEAMRRTKGPRMFPKDVQYFVRNLNLELMVRNLSFGVTLGSIWVCRGCSLCGRGKGFLDYKGKGVFTMPTHPEGSKLYTHSVLILGAGNIEGLDYVSIRNSHGTNWGREGCGDIDIKLFRFVVRLSGIEKKSWNDKDKEWI